MNNLNSLNIKSTEETAWDILSLGEVMLRLDPGAGRIHTTRSFTVWEGGGEYNVARGLRRCFQLRGAVVTSLADNSVGRLVEDCILQGGVDTSLIQWRKEDGIGRNVRNGLNFTERGFGVRGASGCSDRGHTAISQLKVGDIDWEYIFGKRGVKWFHTGGIFAALGAETPDVVIEALQCAKKHGTITSYDLNYRPSLWEAFGGKTRAQEVNKKIAEYVDVMIGNEEDFTACLGLEVPGVDAELKSLPIEGFKKMIEQAVKIYPNFKYVATTLRTVKSASSNDWGAICFNNGAYYQSIMRNDLEIFDRVGGGDSFASGFIYGLLMNLGAQSAVDYGAAHGALAMTTPGDTSMASKSEVERLVKGNSARVKR